MEVLQIESLRALFSAYNLLSTVMSLVNLELQSRWSRLLLLGERYPNVSVSRSGRSTSWSWSSSHEQGFIPPVAGLSFTMSWHWGYFFNVMLWMFWHQRRQNMLNFSFTVNTEWRWWDVVRRVPRAAVTDSELWKPPPVAELFCKLQTNGMKAAARSSRP